jgi:hypothetical protein
MLILILLALSFYWDVDQPLFPPAFFNVTQAAQKRMGSETEKLATGYLTTSTLMEIASYLLEKPGGFITNDVTPPGILMDNTPNWEFGVVTLIRDFTRVLRNDISRSQSQGAEDGDLAQADPHFHFDTESWILPSTESEYQVAIDYLNRYLTRLKDPAHQNAQFYARSDNLREWLALVARRLGSHSQRLSASVGQARLNIDLSGDPAATQSTPTPNEMAAKTPWTEIDDVFYEARGYCWALAHVMEAITVDFKQVLEKKNATTSVQQIIRELNATQDPLYSPMVLNGTGFGPFANHSLVMASYVARANAAVIDLVNLLQQG